MWLRKFTHWETGLLYSWSGLHWIGTITFTMDSRSRYFLPFSNSSSYSSAYNRDEKFGNNKTRLGRRKGETNLMDELIQIQDASQVPQLRFQPSSSSAQRFCASAAALEQR
jgi:hypothetical protein